MPFCEYCGTYEPVFYEGDMCRYCHMNSQRDPHYINKIASRNKEVAFRVKPHLLSYMHELAPQNVYPQNQDLGLMRIIRELGLDAEPNTNHMQGQQNRTPTQRTITTERGTHNVQIGPNGRIIYPPRTFIVSNISLILLLISLFLFPEISIILDVIALVMGLYAKKHEPPSWRVPLVLILAGLFIIFDILILLLGDALLQMANSISTSTLNP